MASHVAGLAGVSGGQLFVGHRGQTVFPLHWSDPSLRSLGHLTPDIVLRRHDEVRIFDAKYKAHFAELDEAGWLRMANDIRDSHRADMHQVLAYAALVDAPRITTTLVYPLRPATFACRHALARPGCCPGPAVSRRTAAHARAAGPAVRRESVGRTVMTERPQERHWPRNWWRSVCGAALVVVMGCVSPPPSQNAQRAAEQWIVERIIRVSESTERHEENVDVRNCTHVEHQSLTCEGAAATVVSAGAGTDTSASVGVDALPAHVSTAIETQVLRESGLTYQRSLGRQYELAPATAGSVRTYRVVYEFKVLHAQAAVRTAAGRAQQFTHPFAVSCEIHADPISEVPCPATADSGEVAGSAEAGGADGQQKHGEIALGGANRPNTIPVVPGGVVTLATPDPSWEYLAIPRGTEVRVRLSDRLGTDLNHQEDPFEARLAKDLKVGPLILRQGGTTLRGVLTEVLVPGRVKGKATLRLRLTALRYGDFELPLNSSEVKRERSSKGKDWLRRGLGAALGAGAGAAVGGREGAAAGAGAGIVVAEGANMIDRGDHLVLEPGSDLEFRLEAPLLIPVRRLR